MSIQHPVRSLAVVEVTRFRGHDPAYHSYVQVLVGSVIAEAERQGWTVTRLAADQGEDALLARTDDADAVLILGGEDIAPEFYGGTTGYEGESRHLEVADAAQIALVRRAIDWQTPVLGICRGLQIINVALGGTLVQHLGDESAHKNDGVPIHEIMSTHPVHLAPGSLVSGLLESATVDVQSAHHQAVDVVGAGLVVTGRAPDGHVEALEHVSAPVVGVQWHPEDPGAPEGQLAGLIASLDRVTVREALAA
ncbi:MAG: gamma-glutamyl-gamma-aminobutyrate hydrolase family protein [Leifsonia sp.]